MRASAPSLHAAAPTCNSLSTSLRMRCRRVIHRWTPQWPPCGVRQSWSCRASASALCALHPTCGNSASRSPKVRPWQAPCTLKLALVSAADAWTARVLRGRRQRYGRHSADLPGARDGGRAVRRFVELRPRGVRGCAVAAHRGCCRGRVAAPRCPQACMPRRCLVPANPWHVSLGSPCCQSWQPVRSALLHVSLREAEAAMDAAQADDAALLRCARKLCAARQRVDAVAAMPYANVRCYASRHDTDQP